MYYIHKDHLGSIYCITDESGNVVQNGVGNYQYFSYDPWGRQRNPFNWTFDKVSYHNLFDRGYTGHEHLTKFGLINMNGRTYDPWLGRMLQPDNYVQAAGYLQNYNRYSYVLNNPLKYTDPTGEKWWHWALADGLTGGMVSLTGITIGSSITATTMATSLFVNSDPAGMAAASWISGFFSTGGGINNRLVAADKRVTNSWRISTGYFKTNKNKTFGGKTWEIISRFSWQNPQSSLGNSFSQLYNLYGDVENVDYGYGATVVHSSKGGEWGVTLGNYIVGANEIQATASNEVFQHEYGHYLQSASTGWFYLSKYGIPSILSRGMHNQHPAEQDANIRAFKYFSDHIDNFNYIDDYGIQHSQWKHGYYENPIIGYDWSSPYSTMANQNALNSGKMNLVLYDYVGGPNVIFSGIINALILNKK